MHILTTCKNSDAKCLCMTCVRLAIYKNNIWLDAQCIHVSVYRISLNKIPGIHFPQQVFEPGL